MVTDEDWIRRAVELALVAESIDEVPVGALLIKDGMCLSEGWNQSITTGDPTAHAEIIALRKAGSRLENYRLVGTTLYVTLEPCMMCIGALIQARIGRLVFGAYDEKRGAVCSAYQIEKAIFLNHKFEWKGGILGDECRVILQNFFTEKRIL